MLILRGAPALSSFRTQKLLTTLQQRVPAVTGVSSEFVHFANVAVPLNAEQQQVLQQLLTYGPKVEAQVSHEGELFLVVPREARAVADRNHRGVRQPLLQQPVERRFRQKSFAQIVDNVGYKPAAEDGIVPGGGVAFLRAIEAVENAKRQGKADSAVRCFVSATGARAAAATFSRRRRRSAATADPARGPQFQRSLYPSGSARPVPVPHWPQFGR